MTRHSQAAAAAALLIAASAAGAAGQEAVKVEAAAAPAASPQPAADAAAQPMPGATPMGTPPMGATPMGTPPMGTTPMGTPAPPAVVTRPAKPAFDADPKELDIKPVDGKVRFNFHGQPWQGVLEWLAGISGLSLDWQELPGDHLNLRTQREYSLDEARDLLNQHLLARGFTMLRQGEVLTVVKLEKLDPALVPQVDAKDLDTRDPHEFVQTTFPLDWLPAPTAEEELKPLLSPKGKLTKLTTTNRLHAIDVVANLRAVRDLLTEEQSGRGRERLVRSFKLKHARAADVKDLLEDFLGVAKKGGGMSGDPNQMAMMMQQQMQMMQQQMQQQQQGGAGGAPKKEEISIIANPRENEIIAQAGPETMAVIEQTVKLLDAAPDPNDTLDRQLTRYRVFRLGQLDPDTLVKMLNDMGGLDPTTKLTADKKNRSVVVNGPLVDHVVVQQVVERLDGSDRSFEVVRLRRLPADYVAGTIRFMMGGEEEKKEDNSYRRYYYYDPWGSNNEEEDDASRKFRVDADVENNRLLLWANEIELEEVQKLLVKLGEVRPSDGERSTVRVLNVSGEQAEEFLRRLRESWSAGGTHPLLIDPAAKPEGTGDPFAPETEAAPEAEKPAEQPQNDAKPAVTSVEAAVTAAESNAEEMLLALADEAVPEADAITPDADAVAPDDGDAGAVEPETGPRVRGDDPFGPGTRRQTPVRVTRDREGRLVIQSDDPQALDAVEDLMYELAPPPKDYEVFKLKYPTTWAWGIVLNLEDFFGVDEKDGSGGDDDYFRGYFGYPPSGGSKSEGTGRLSQRRKLQFIADEDSRTIIVQGATPEQLKTIGELIELYDKPQSQSSGDLRVTKLFKVKHAKAETIAEAIKDVYRDLLSANDRALQSNPNQQGQQQPVAERSYTYVYGGTGGDNKEQPQAPIKFKGLLSIGVDKESNTLVVSSSQSLIDDLGTLIESLDMASQQKEAVSVVRTGGGGVPRNLSNRLKEIFGDKVKIAGDEEPKTSERATPEPELE